MGKQKFKSFKGSDIDVDVDVDVNIDIDIDIDIDVDVDVDVYVNIDIDVDVDINIYFTCESRISDSSCLVVAVIVMLVRPPRDRIER